MIHGEINCLNNAAKTLDHLRGMTMYSTLMPWIVCIGSMVKFGIAKVTLAARPRNNGLSENHLQQRQLFRLLLYWSLLVTNAIRKWRFSSPESNPRTGC